ncbi:MULTISPECIES: MBL fold metallo-hydrolase [unclassified Kitasatospora]|uniref:MBL fold metallo-hydrolase n=1 Tax=unclassified Kitasatospora TaxID=2633591 RepID=UPI0007110967|nr:MULTISPECIES: MBL fold metallo-hydrolase [unclassified Kitasatospora]KQV19157.1 MBL fold metallo-hydrolase [Kitasatospora sp. Root107]KRB75591.1 MBL fold metallo-hydrolase [Kitasatospora sp. Root187]
MRLTKFGHACVRVETERATVVIDPGAFTEEDALRGADAVLITHEHFDHFVEDRLRAAVEADPGLRIWTNGSVARQLTGLGSRVRVVGEGDAFEINGLDVSVHGEWHALIHPDIPRVGNVGFLLDGRLFHPGDALTLPPQPVETLLLPLAAPWARIADLIEYVREVAPRRALAVHEAVLSEAGQAVHVRLIGGTAGVEFGQPKAGEQLDLDGAVA